MSAERQDAIVVIGARVHNLKKATATIPLHSVTVVTGVSGSGKSSLAFDTLYAEGQRRYVASLSAYARQFLERLDKPDVDDILGVCPALAIRQKNYSRNPRSTVGTVTEISDYLRLLFARIGITICHSCRRRVEKDSPEKIADFVLSLPEGTRLHVAYRLDLSESQPPPGEKAGRRRPSPVADPLRAEERLSLILPGLRQQGLLRLLVGAEVVPLEDALDALKRSADKDVHVVIDRLVVRKDIRKRLADSLELCGRESGGRIELVLPQASEGPTQEQLEQSQAHLRWVRHPAGIILKFSEKFECQLCQVPYEEPEPRLFSFNNPYGACPSCQGFGNTITLDLDRVVPDPRKSLAQGAIDPWTKPRYKQFQTRLLAFAAKSGIPVDQPWSDLAPPARERLIRGHGGFPGILGFFEQLETKKYKMHVRVFISRYRGYATCTDCGGERLRREARDVYIRQQRISDISRMTISEAAAFFHELQPTPQEASISGRVLQEIRHRLALLEKVGLEYLTLDRLSSTLSGGESQRIQLAAALGSTLVGILYVLDEPSIGLHARDSQRLVEILKGLREIGNTVVVVEHDADIMAAADHIIDLGPGAGEHGGSVVFEGTHPEILRCSRSLTGRYLSGEMRIPVPLFRRKSNGRNLEVFDAHKHNLKHFDLQIPLGLLVCITGVSGSGKSTLVNDILYAGLKKAKGDSSDLTAGYGRIEGARLISEVVLADQSPIGRTPRSNPATYCKAFDEIRSIFAKTRDAYARNLGAGSFSFNLSGGRCETCQGNGTITVEMQFLADVELTCEDCKGTRFKPGVLEVRFKGKNIAEVLDLTVQEATQFFAGHARLVRKLRVLEEVGLGYLRLGQSATTLSGGEAQRMKLASFIARKSTVRTLFIFDEPTTGLHFDDIRKLLHAFDKLIGAGNSLIVIEHNLDVIKTADWIIDLGPEGGDGGGHVLFQGSPDDLIRHPQTHTGRYLSRYVQNR